MGVGGWTVYLHKRARTVALMVKWGERGTEAGTKRAGGEVAAMTFSYMGGGGFGVSLPQHERGSWSR